MRESKNAFFAALALLILLTCGSTQAAFASASSSDLREALASPDFNIDSIDLQREDLNAFYNQRNFAPAWSFTGTENLNALNGFLDSISQIIDFHGLSRDDYPLDLMRKLAGSPDDKDAVKLEILVTDSLMRLAHALHGDQNELEDIYVGWTLHRQDADIPALLQLAVVHHNLAEFIASLAPKNAAYDALAKALQLYRGYAAAGGWKKISNGKPLQPQDRDSRVTELRARLAAEGFLSPVTQNDLFDNDLAKILQTWQSLNGLDTDAHVGGKTLTVLNQPVSDRIDQIRANMERWRHIPEDFPPSRYTLVNIANASIDIVEDNKAVYRGPVVVGRVDRKTPFIASIIRSMIINPSWHVPAKIAREDILPKLRKDPHYLEKLGFVISGHGDDPHGDTIDWATMPDREFNFRLRQEPGDGNSLGPLKFDFDNDFAVYMHGTPHQNLFARAQRNYSSGCIRLRDPEQVAEIVLRGNEGAWTADKIDEAIDAGKTRWIGLTQPLPIYVLYWTVFADESGAINFRRDVYDYDHMLTAPPAIDMAPSQPKPSPRP